MNFARNRPPLPLFVHGISVVNRWSTQIRGLRVSVLRERLKLFVFNGFASFCDFNPSIEAQWIFFVIGKLCIQVPVLRDDQDENWASIWMRRLEPGSWDHCRGLPAWQGLIDAGRQSAVLQRQSVDFSTCFGVA